MTDHARLSPSARYRWSVCPGSVREEAKYPESTGTAAVDGTHSHTLLAYCIKHDLLDPTTLVGSKMSDQDGEFRVDVDRANRVKVAVDYVKGRTHGHGHLFRIYSEERVDPAPLLGRSDMAGTLDVRLWYASTYEIIDYKDGMSPVDVFDNPQLILYALGALCQPDLLPFNDIKLTIIQPKLALKGQSHINSHTMSLELLKSKIPQIIAEAAATDNPEAPLVPGDKQCKWCAHRGACSALAGAAMKEVGLMFQPVPGLVPSSFDMAQQSADKNPATMDADQIRQILEAAPLVRQFIEGVESEAQRRMEAGQPVPGFKLVRGRGSRSWTLPDAEMAEKLIKMGIPKGAVFVTKVVSPAAAEKLTWTKKKRGSETEEVCKLSDRQIKTINAEYIAKSSGKLTVAPESDDREAVITDAAPMFSAVEPAVVVAPELPPWLTVPAWL